MKHRDWLWGTAAVILVAAALRMPSFGRFPPGLYRDEAINGLDALDVLQGEFSLYFTANNGREPLFIYLVAASVGIFGRSPFALRLPSLFTGILTVAATAAMARALFSRRVGLLSSAVVAAILWHVHLSRTGYRAVLLPLISTLALWQGALAVRTGRWPHWVAAGALLGLSAYSYTAARLVPFALAAFLVYAWIAWPQALCRRSPLGLTTRRGVGIAVIVALLVSAPLLVYAILEPEIVLGRPGQVSVFSPEIHGGDLWASLGRHLAQTLGMFFIRGDRIWRHNVPWRPVFDPVLGIAFVAGLVLAIRRIRRHPPSALLILWTGTLVLPTMLAEDAPHFLRAVGVLPVAAVFPGLGLDWLWGALARPHLARDRPQSVLARQSRRMAASMVLALALAAGLGSTACDYFGPYGRDPMTAFWFEQGAVELAGSINGYLGTGWDGDKLLHSSTPGREAYVDPKLWSDWPQVRFLVPGSEALVVGRGGRHVSAAAAAFVWPYDDWSWVWDVLPSPRELTVELGPLSQGDRDTAPYRTFQAFYGRPPDAATLPIVRLSQGVEYLGLELATTGQGVEVRLRWRATQSLDAKYTIFLHYLRGGELVGQADAEGAMGLYPTDQWDAGDVINDTHLVETVTQPDPTRDVLRFGFWQPTSDAVLYVLDEAGNPAGDWIEVSVGG